MFINREKLDDIIWSWGKRVLVEYKTQENKTQEPKKTLQYYNYEEYFVNDSTLNKKVKKFTFYFRSNVDSSTLSICSNKIARVSFENVLLFEDSETILQLLRKWFWRIYFHFQK